MNHEPETVPIPQKMTLTIREAAAYSNIGINKIDHLLRNPNCPFVLFVGTKKLVKRKEFEEYISNKSSIYELAVLRKESPFVIIRNIAKGSFFSD